MNSSSETTVSGGTFANNTGNRLEAFVEQALKEKGYTEFWNHKEQLFLNRESVGGKQYGKHINVGETIYGTKRLADIFILNKDLFPDGLIIECKWQQSGGSVDEKYQFLLYNIIKTGVPTVVLLDGDGYKASAKEWLKLQANPERSLIGVWSMSEFHRKVNDGFLG